MMELSEILDLNKIIVNRLICAKTPSKYLVKLV